MKKLFYSGNGTTAVDSGLPNVGRFFGVSDSDELLWFSYLGHGEPDRSGTNGFEPNTGNPIGRGWGSFLFVLGCGDGVIMGVQPDGHLLWYGYNGNGEADQTGAAGFHPNSGNVIGRGFQEFTNVFVLPGEGRENTAGITILGVRENGDLQWYRYTGNGEADETGASGFDPGSGAVIGTGWGDFRLIVGTGSGAIFTVGSDAALRWYHYNGSGDTTGWHANSGNQIGRGWASIALLTGGSTDVDGFGTVLYAVAENRDLLWYRYDGFGEPDPTGAAGFRANSGNAIGNGF